MGKPKTGMLMLEQLTILKLLSTALAIIAVLRFYRATKHEVAAQNSLLKLISFKLIVFLNFVQTVRNTAARYLQSY